MRVGPDPIYNNSVLCTFCSALDGQPEKWKQANVTSKNRWTILFQTTDKDTRKPELLEWADWVENVDPNIHSETHTVI